jgi:Na+/melibiose symporter-like transporter
MDGNLGVKNENSRALTLWQQLLYALGNFGVAFSPTVVSAWLGYFYYGQETEAGKQIVYVNAAVFGSIWFLCNALNGFTDPVVGYLSDRTTSKMGRRRPWILLGAPFLALSFFFLWTPITPEHSFANSALLFTTLFFFWFFFTVVVGPYCALLPDITPFPRERVRISAFMGACEVIGSVMGNLMPPLMMSLLAGGILFLKTGYQVMAFIAATSLAFFFTIAVLAVKERFAHKGGEQSGRSVVVLILAALGIEAVIVAITGGFYLVLERIYSVLTNIAEWGQTGAPKIVLMLVLYAVCLAALAYVTYAIIKRADTIRNALREFFSVFRNSAFPPYVIGIGFYRMSIATVVFITPFIATKILGSYPPTDSELSILKAVGALKDSGVPDWELAAGYLMMLVMVGAAIFFPLVSWLSHKTGKRSLYILALVWMGVIMILMSTIGLWKFASPLIQAAVLFLFAAFPVAIALVIIRPLLADVIDADEKITGKRREGVYNGMEGLIMKVAAGLGPLFAGFIFATFGSSVNSNLGIRICGPVAGVCLLIAAFSFTKYPIKD